MRSLRLLYNQAFINGKWTNARSGLTFVVKNPFDGSQIACVPDMSVEDVKLAVMSAHHAQNQWSLSTSRFRSQLLYKFYSLLCEHRQSLAELITAEQGKPLSEALAEVDYSNSFIEWFAAIARNINGEIVSNNVTNRENIIIRQPIGVTALITPWNFPQAMITRKMGAALACGCACIVKPAEDTPLSALVLAYLASQAGVPDGVVNVVPCSRHHVQNVVHSICTDFRVRALSFTGSTQVGKLLYEQCAQDMKKVCLELGGNAPAIIFNSADITLAVSACMKAKFRNGGQACISVNRFLVQSEIYDRFLHQLSDSVSNLVTGDGFHDDTHIGPLINRAQYRKVSQIVTQAIQEGAKIHIGEVPNISENHSLIYSPTILTNLDPNMQIFQTEIFGPIVALYRFETEEEAIRLANDTSSGLASYIFSTNISQCFRVARLLQFGIVGVNEGAISQPETPLGGWKHSGLGTEGSHFCVEDFTELKTICLAT